MLGTHYMLRKVLGIEWQDKATKSEALYLAHLQVLNHAHLSPRIGQTRKENSHSADSAHEADGYDHRQASMRPTGRFTQTQVQVTSCHRLFRLHEKKKIWLFMVFATLTTQTSNGIMHRS